MRKFLFAATLAVLAAGCTPETTADPTQSKAPTVSLEIGGKAARCLPADALQITSLPGTELVGDVRERMLTPAANTAGVRIYVPGNDVTNFGSVTVYYMNSAATCYLWIETLGLQEFAEKAGLNPLGIANGYEPAKPAAVTTPAPAAPAK